MARRFAWLALSFAAVGLVACSSLKYSFPTTDELRQTGRFSEEELESLEEGRILAVTECADCHRMYWPAEKQPEAWPGILHAMGTRASFEPEDVHDLSFYYDIVSSAVSTGDIPWLPSEDDES